MAVDMVTADQMLKIDYRDGIHSDINERVPMWSMLEREGEEYAQEADTHRFAIKIAPGQNAREYGPRSPREFARTDGEMVDRKVDVGYNIGYNPVRINPDIVWRAANGKAAMINMLKETLKDLRDSVMSQKERATCSGYGHDLLFEFSSIPAVAPWTYGVTDYAGLAGEELGFILKVMNLRNMYMNVASPALTGSPLGYRTVRNGGVPNKVTGISSVLSSETVTFDNEFVGAAIGDVVFRSHDEQGGIQLTNQGMMGFPGVVDNFTLVDPFQTINSTDDTAESFRSEQIDAGGAALNEDFLMQALTSVGVLLGGGQEDGTKVRHVMVGNTITVNAFAQSLTAIQNVAGAEADRGRRVTYNVTQEGYEPKYGYRRKSLFYNGTPFVDGQLCLRNSIFTINLDDIVLIHNGPPEGDFLTPAGGGPQVLRVPGSPQSEYVWYWMCQIAARRRNGCNRIFNLASPQYM